ncbi:MAG: hypothetical protein M0R17_06170 [Candidatus Omnitrophica bacterium]|jgi:hypothetical protein|nr:hypothetical protein [Candidatus Omnitrophota bacterium]
MKIRIQKIKEVEKPVHPNNISVGYIREMFVDEKSLPPTVNERFPRNTPWSTSIVQEVINEHTFRTLNSIYTWEVIDD